MSDTIVGGADVNRGVSSTAAGAGTPFSCASVAAAETFSSGTHVIAGACISFVGASVGGTACRTNCESEAEGCINDASGQAVGMSSRLSRLSFVSSSLYNRHD